MQRNINSLIGYRMEATDGEIGKVEEFYFDDDTWTIRYLILKTENWLSGRRVLISPDAVLKATWKPGVFLVNITKDQISRSPDIDTDKPVYRQQEIELYGYFGWQGYWQSGFYGGAVEGNGKRPDVDLHLRSSRQVTGYHIHGTDGEIGHIKDFIMDDQTWKLVYLVGDTYKWPGAVKLLIPVSRIKQMKWTDSEIYVDLTVAALEKSELFDPAHFTEV